jgi:uncharacterized protein
VSPRWLAMAFGLTILLAAICGYGALCLLFYQGQWQLLFHPSRTVAATPASAGLAFSEVHFDVTDAGQAQLDGWWIPAAAGSQYDADTVLYLHDGQGSLSDCVPALTLLHGLGVNVFAFDYRGFGHSAGSHPTERLVNADADAAWTYLTDLRHITPRRLVVFGSGVGATFAAHLGAQFAPAGVVLQDPSPSARHIFLTDARARILPLWLLQNEKLDPGADLAAEHAPRLFLDVRGDSARTRALFEASSYPKEYFDLRSSPESTVTATLRRFFDEVLTNP